MENQQRPTVTGLARVDVRPLAGFVLSLVAGLLILVGGVATLSYHSGPFGGIMDSYTGMTGGSNGGMMNGYYGMMEGFGVWFYGFAIVGIVTGLLVVFAALMMYDRPEQVATWGVLILVFSLVSLFGAGGFFVGAILGMVGGILALTWRRSRPSV